MSYETAIKISDVIHEIDRNHYVLPSIQREFVWTTHQVEILFDSIMQEYPIGSFLFWKVDKENYQEYEFYRFLCDYHEKKATHNPKANLAGDSDVVAILDGQQRLTSIYLGLKGSYAYKLPYKQWKSDDAFPKRRLFLNLLSDSKDYEQKYEFKFLTKAESINECESDKEHYWFKVGDIITLTEIESVMDYMDSHISYCDLYTKDQKINARKTLLQLFQVVHNKPLVSYYLEKSQNLDKVLNIFIRVNSGGTILSYSDLLLSIASAQWEKHDAREEINEFVDSTNSIGNGFNINKDFVLKAALVLSDFNNIAFKVDNFNKTNMLKIENGWDEIKQAISLAVQLVASFGYSRDTLKSNNALIPIAYYIMKIGLPLNYITSSKTKDDRILIRKWLVRSLLKRAFSGQPDNVLRPIREIIRDNASSGFPYDKIIEKFKGTNKTIVFTKEDIDDYLLQLKYSNADTLSTLMVIYPGYDYSNSIHIDHIFPKSLFSKKILKKFGVSDSNIQFYIDNFNMIANLQLLPQIPNIEKQNKEFSVWFAETYKTSAEKNQYRIMHFIPEMDYSFINFNQFIISRTKILRDALEKELL